MAHQITTVGAHLPASLAHVRLLTRMYSRVYCQSRALDELLPTARPVTSVRSNSGMNSLCNQVRKGSLAGVGRITYRVAQGRCGEQNPCCRLSSGRSSVVPQHHSARQEQEALAAFEVHQRIHLGHNPCFAEWHSVVGHSRRAPRGSSPSPPEADEEDRLRRCYPERLVRSSW